MGQEVFDKLIEDIWAEWQDKSQGRETFSHHGEGTSLRNSLGLWWQPDSKDPKPPIVEFFNSKNIFFGDDMSGTIQEAIRAKSKGEIFDIDEHLKIYFQHWKEHGFKDGIFTEKRNRK